MRLHFLILLLLIAAAWSEDAGKQADGRYERTTKRYAGQKTLATIIGRATVSSAGGTELIAGGGLADGRHWSAGQARGALAIPPGAQVRQVRIDRAHGSGSGSGSPIVVLWKNQLASVDRILSLPEGLRLVDACTTASDRIILLVDEAAPSTAEPTGGDDKRRVPAPTQRAVICLKPDGTLIWSRSIGTASVPSRLWTDAQGRIYADASGLQRIAADGSKSERVAARASTDRDRWLAVEPDGAHAWYGGDRNTRLANGGPYRQPFLYRIQLGGAPAAETVFYQPDPKAVGSLESDSRPNDLCIAPDGRMIMAGWSDGGNTVLYRNPLDHRSEQLPEAAAALEGSNVNGALSCGHLVWFNAKQVAIRHASWVSYLPMTFATAKVRGRANTAMINRVTWLGKDGIAFAGEAATGLPQTPGAIFTPPTDGSRYGGRTFTIMRGDGSSVLYSSYLPGWTSVAPVAVPGGAMALGAEADGGDAAAQRGKGETTKTKGTVILFKVPSE